jgi:GntR family transcriptional regulator/MocR family aminotransferase
MVSNISQAMFLTAQYVSGILQAALADFIEEGHFTTHLGRMRRLYNKRREDFMVSCQAELGEWLDPAPTDSGIQSLWYCRAGLDDVEISQRARQNGVVVTPLSLHYRQGPPRHGLILGYTALERSALLAELKTLRRIFIDVRTRH